MNNPPFQPPVFTNVIPKGGWSSYSGPWCTAPDPYPPYNGQDQTARINSAQLPPPTTPAKCRLPGAAVGLSKIFNQP
jgi:hypothetical protein